MIPNILSIAGSDPSGGAGIQADIKAISANGGYAMAAITALTAQNTQGVQAVQMVAPDFVTQQIAALRADIRIDAVKIGMLGSAEMVNTARLALDGLDVPVVLDPVMVAKGGDRLLQADAVAALRAALSMASVITPNLPEAADLLGQAEADTRDQMESQAQALLALGPKAVLLKGGHLPGRDCPDLLATADGQTWLPGPRHDTRRTHGTGCTLSSALATLLGHKQALPQACIGAKAYVSGAIRHSGALSVGQGHGPTHHFHALKVTQT
ncbi:bifunctional hydroxymethylpyrimidine kinase/phosphomethylpyrimidine kinase [Roseibaca sp. V10]|uniref:hydroxymethylpyrimidine kinase n=1 Tax=Roseinatronobacter domitianus TaxID=2940293 RepID=A0ABT0M2U3_9RHOB|nr:bifunctional hydroxymethylpyrimidine kinase/phosphomethylpyrimidine kinase [Roseibaca domitiana]MCL1629008.1 bifunctional hydroxymethylpyrimidine kinase/phosphomethylpyrimidine kinase [Roseibaca domitiana]